MDLFSSRYRKPKSRPSKRKRAAINNAAKRWSVLETDATSPSRKQSVDSVNDPSTSFTKLQPILENNITESSCNSPSYAFVNLNVWENLLANIKCSECSSGTLTLNMGNMFGFSSKFELICKDCNHLFGSSFTSPRIPEEKGFEVNKKVVEAFLRFGKGHAAIEILSMVLGIQSVDKKTFAKCLNSLAEDGKDVRKEMLEISRNVVRKRHLDFDPSLNEEDIIDITVSYDGTWQKRGHTSLYGIDLVIDIMTGLVIDYEVLSKYCPECAVAARDLGENSPEFEIWFTSHQTLCQKNHAGSSGSMEVNAASILWSRSVEECKMRYTTVLSDGDSKTFQMLQNLKPYGSKHSIKKEECINHVAKRLGTGLCNKVKEWKSKGFCLGGKKQGSLKETTIVKLTNFYRKAIKDNVPDVQKMKTAVLASLYHSSSTDAKPKHNKCPEGSSSWCFYKRALANNEVPGSHKKMKTQLSEEVLEKVLPVYQRLASDELLKRCISGKTQNANESVHSVICKNCPKETFVSKKRLELSVISSISTFNIGCLGTLKVMDKNAEAISTSIARKRDKRRLELSEKRKTKGYK